MDEKELVKILDFIDRRTKEIRKKIEKMNKCKLKQEIDILVSQIRFLSSDD